MKQITPDELFAMFDESVHQTIRDRVAWKQPADTEAVVVFENQQMDSSAFGDRTAVVVGPGCTIRSVKACKNQHLNDLPSQRQYPVAFCPTVELREQHAATT